MTSPPDAAQRLAVQAYPGGGTFGVVRGDLLHEPVDAIVNAANGHLAHGGGVAALIARAAGAEFVRDCEAWVRAHGPIPVGDAVATGAGRLRFRGVIHAVGPRGGDGDEGVRLEQAVASAFRCAEASGWASLAFPAVSSGIFAVPPETCAAAYLRAVRAWFTAPVPRALRTIRLCLRDTPLIDAVLAAFPAAAP